MSKRLDSETKMAPQTNRQVVLGCKSLVERSQKITNCKVKTILMAFFIAATLSACIAVGPAPAGGHHAIPTRRRRRLIRILLRGATTLTTLSACAKSSFPCCKAWIIHAGSIKYGSASSINPRSTRLTQAIVSFMLRRDSCAGPTTINSAASWLMKSPTKISVTSPKRKSSARVSIFLRRDCSSCFPRPVRWRPLPASWSRADMDAPKSLPPTAMASISCGAPVILKTLWSMP